MNAPPPHAHATCGALTRGGTPCRRAPLPNGRCNLHGGKSLAGIASPSFRTGRYSKHLPERLTARYHEAASDPDLLALREDIALIDARLADLLGRVDRGEPGALWQAVSDAWDTFRRKRGGTQEQDAFMALAQAIEDGMTDFEAWAEIHTILEQRRKLVESERKRLVEMRQMVTVEQAMTFVAAIQESVRRHVTDRETLALIASDMAALAQTSRLAAA